MKRLLLAGLILWGGARVVADETTDQIKSAASLLDNLLTQEKRTAVITAPGSRAVKKKIAPLQADKYLPTLSELLRMERSDLEKALRREKVPASDIVFARLLAAKNNEPVKKYLKAQPTEQWLRELEANQIPLERVHDVLENIYVEMAFIAFDDPFAKRAAISR